MDDDCTKTRGQVRCSGSRFQRKSQPGSPGGNRGKITVRRTAGDWAAVERKGRF